MRLKIRSQPRIKGGHIPGSSAFDPRIKHHVESDATRWRCSQSWVIQTALAALYGVDIIVPTEELHIYRRRRKP